MTPRTCTSSLSNADIIDLLGEARLASTPEARERCEDIVAREFLSLADALARRYTGRGVEDDDLRGTARLALVSAMRRFDPKSGAFAAFAKATIDGEIKKHFRDRAWMIRPPRALTDGRVTVLRCRAERTAAGLPVGDADVAATTGLETATVTEINQLDDKFRPVSVDNHGPAGGRQLSAVLPDDRDGYASVEDLDEVRRYIDILSDRDRQLIRLRFIDELTQSEIAVAMGVSQVQVSRLLQSCLNRMRAVAESQAA